MGILFRYILREHVKAFAMCFGGLMTVYLVVDFFEKVRKFVRYDAELATILWYFALRTPAISLQIVPLAVLMATLLTLGVFSRTNEVTAMRSCGISLFRVALPFLYFSLSAALVLFILSAVGMPLSAARAEYVKTALIEKKPSGAAFKTDRLWLRLRDRALMNVEVVDPDGMTLQGVTVYRLGEDFRIAEIVEGRTMTYTDGGWVLASGTRRRLFPDGGLEIDTVQQLPIELSQKPDDFRTWLSVESEQMTLAQIRAYVDRLRRDGYSVSRFATDYHGRVAFPFVTVVMAIVAIALSLMRTGVRGGGMAMGIGLALVVGFLYWSAHSVSIALGRTGVLAPPMAGWMANLLFTSFGFYLFLRVRQ
jgi:lipopolysaccharide export system permease protein